MIKKKSSSKKKIVRKPRVEKTRNAGTMTESAFFSMIRSALRNKSRFWKPILECKKKNRRDYNGINKRQKFEYQCNHCKNWYIEKQIEVDHIIECGGISKFEDVGDFCKRLFVEEEGFQLLCLTCHGVKTQNYLKQKRENGK